MAVMKFDCVARHPNDPLHEHIVVTRGANGNHVTPLRLMEQIGQPINEVDAMVLVSRKHARPLYTYGEKDEFEYDHARNHQDRHANQCALWIPSNHNALP